MTSSKLQPCLLKMSLKTPKKLTEFGIIYLKTIYICISWYNKKFWFSLKRSWSQQNSRDVSSDLSIFLHLPWVRYNCAEFHHSRICATDFRELLFCPLYHPWALPKVAILNRFKVPDLMVYSTCFFAYVI